jgi:hypothetical protein
MLKLVTWTYSTAAPPFEVHVGAGGGTIEDADGDRLLLYGEALAVNLALFEGVKHLVQRPRPYLYSSSPEVARAGPGPGRAWRRRRARRQAMTAP